MPLVPVAPEDFQPVFLENETQRECLVKEIEGKMEKTNETMQNLRSILEDIAHTQAVDKTVKKPKAGEF